MHRVTGYVLRKPEPEDLERLYEFKNDPSVSRGLGGFSTGFSRADLREWLEHHRTRKDEVLWAIVDEANDQCVGHVGLYQLDFRARTGEFAILLGNPAVWGRGLGRACTRFAVAYGFRELNLHRISLSVLATNSRARALYDAVGFQVEGTLRDAQYKDGAHHDVVIMSLLRAEHDAEATR